MDMVSIAIGAAIALVVTSLYNLLETAIRKRVSVRSPEAKAIEQIVPAVNALLESNSPIMLGLIAIMEATQGQCNGNVTEALKINRKAKEKFDDFLNKSAMVKTS